MITHIIYELPGRKVGCCRDLKARKRLYPRHQTRLLRVLEELHDMTDQEAGDREWEWADKLGYKRGVHYTRTLMAVRKSAEVIPYEDRVDRARNMNEKRATHSPQRRSEIARQRIAQIPLEKRIEIARNATAHLTPEQRSANARLGGSTTTPETGRKVGTAQGRCPHCGLKANLGNLHRWHFDHCPHKP